MVFFLGLFFNAWNQTDSEAGRGCLGVTDYSRDHSRLENFLRLRIHKLVVSKPSQPFPQNIFG